MKPQSFWIVILLVIFTFIPNFALEICLGLPRRARLNPIGFNLSALRADFAIAKSGFTCRLSHAAEKQEILNQLPEKYFSGDYLYGISKFQGLDETVKAVESLDAEAQRPAFTRYLDMANEYEGKAESAAAKMEKGSEQAASDEGRRDLLIAVNCFEILSRSSIPELKDKGDRGVKRCRKKLMALKPGEFEDQYAVLQRCLDIDQNPDVKKKEEQLKAYYDHGKEYEDKANKAADKQYKRKNVLSALDFYGMVSFFTKDEGLKKQANDARLRCVKMMADLGLEPG